MAKNLRNIILAGVASSALLLSGCPLWDKVVSLVSGHQTSQTQATDQQKTDYQRTVDIANNAAKEIYGTGAQSLVPRKLEDYFFQGKELDGLRLASAEEYLSSQTFGFNSQKPSDAELNDYSIMNGHLVIPRKLGEFKQKMNDLGLNGNALTNQGIGEYIFTAGNPEKPVFLEEMVFEFSSEAENWSFLISQGTNRNELYFINSNITTMIKAFGPNYDLEQEKSLVDTLINYAKRIGGKFYSGGDKNQKGDAFALWDNVYATLEIPVKESAKYLANALETEKPVYNMDESQIKDFWNKMGLQNLLNDFEKYKSDQISRFEIEQEYLRFCKNAERKLIYALPQLRTKLYSSNDSVVGQLLDIYYNDELREKLFDK